MINQDHPDYEKIQAWQALASERLSAKLQSISEEFELPIEVLKGYGLAGWWGDEKKAQFYMLGHEFSITIIDKEDGSKQGVVGCKTAQPFIRRQHSAVALFAMQEQLRRFTP